MYLFALKPLTCWISPVTGGNGFNPNTPKLTLVNRRALRAVKVQTKPMEEREQPLLQESSAVSSRREMMNFTAISLCFASVFFPATAEARPGNPPTMKEKITGKVDELKGKAGELTGKAGELKDKVGLPKGNMEDLKGKAGELKDKAGFPMGNVEDLKGKTGELKDKAGELKDKAGLSKPNPGGMPPPPRKDPSVPLLPTHLAIS